LVPGELELLQGSPAGFSLMKFLIWKGRFPRDHGELRDEAVEHVVRQAGVPAADVVSYGLGLRTPNWVVVGVRSEPLAGSQLLAGDHRGHAPISDSAAAQAGAGSLTLVVLSTTASMKP
jgi:hypothetical protein